MIVKIQSSLICTLLLFSGLGFNCDSPGKEDRIEKDVLTLVAKIPLPGVSGRIDHLAYDSVHQLAYIAALGNNTIEVVNIETKQVVHTITGLHSPQGVVFIYPLHRLAVANDDGGTCMFFDAKSYTLLTTIDLKDDADNMRYDEPSGLLYVGYGSGGIAIIDAAAMKQTAVVPLDGHPESFQLDAKRHRIYINVPGENEIEVADLSTHTVVAKWGNTEASSNFPMALDEQGGKLLIGFRSPAKLGIKNIETGTDIALLPCSGDADDVFYDATDSLVYLSGGKGFVDVFKAFANNEYARINHIATHSGARTSLLLAGSKQFLLAVPAGNSSAAELWIYRLEN